MSFNYHRDHFGETSGIQDEFSETIHTGGSRSAWMAAAVALFGNGLDTEQWPAGVRSGVADVRRDTAVL